MEAPTGPQVVDGVIALLSIRGLTDRWSTNKAIATAMNTRYSNECLHSFVFVGIVGIVRSYRSLYRYERYERIRSIRTIRTIRSATCLLGVFAAIICVKGTRHGQSLLAVTGVILKTE